MYSGRARVCPACARAWRRARDLAALVRARRSARPPAGAQHRLRPGVCMRGVSERVGGRAGWAAESSRGAPPFSGRPGTRPAPRSPRRGEARRQLGPPGVPLPNSWPRPGGLQARRGGGVARGLQRSGHAQLALFRAPAAGGGRGRAEPPGRAAEGPRGVPRTKGDGDGSSVVKTTCAGGRPRSGRGLGALRLNPFPAAVAASALRLAADDWAGLVRSLLGAGSGPQRAEAGRAPATPLSRPSPRSSLRLLLPRPLPTWIPGRLANSLLREAGRGRGTDPT